MGKNQGNALAEAEAQGTSGGHLLAAKVAEALDSWVPAGLLGILLILITVEVILRGVFHVSITWMTEIEEMGFAWTVFLAGAAAVRNGNAIAVDAAMGLIPQRIRPFFDRLVTLGQFAVAAGVFYYAVRQLPAQQGQATPVLGIPFAVRTASLILSMGLICLYSVAQWFGVPLKSARGGA